jgi:hypothetical protein
LQNFNSLTELEDFIASKNDAFIEIENKRKKKNTSRDRHIKIKEEGENDAVTVLDTDKITIYNPTTEAGAKFYGKNTRWCASSDSNNMFSHYNNDGPLYIIILKSNPDKYQLHFPSTQFMDRHDDTIDIRDLQIKINDDEFNNWLISKFKENINIDTIEYAPKELCDDDEFMKPSILNNPKLFEYASETLKHEFKQNDELMKQLILKNTKLFDYASETLKQNDEFMKQLIMINPSKFDYASETLKQDDEFIKQYIMISPYNLKYASENIKEDFEFMNKLISSHEDRIEFIIMHGISEKLKNNDEFMMPLVLKYPRLLYDYTSETLKQDDEFLKQLIMVDSFMIEYASENITNNDEFMMPLILKHPRLYDYASETLKQDDEFMKQLIMIDPHKLENASENIKEDFEFMNKLIASHKNKIYFIMDFISERLKNNDKFMMPLVLEDSTLYEYASQNLQDIHEEENEFYNGRG